MALDGTKIETLRHERRMSRKTLATETGMTERTIYSIERVANHRPMPTAAGRIARVLGVKPEDIVTSNGHQAPEGND